VPRRPQIGLLSGLRFCRLGRYTFRVVVKRGLTTTGVVLMIALLGFVPVEGNPEARNDASTLLYDLGFSLSSTRTTTSQPRSQNGVLVPTPWGEVEATIVSTPVDRMLRVPLSSGTDSSRLQPYFTAGSRKNVDDDPVLEQARPTAFADESRTNMKAGAGVVWKVDDNVELFGEYQFMRLQRDGASRGALGPLGTSLDSSGFSLGLSIRY
jgi:opacity protein-like surface antigen